MTSKEAIENRILPNAMHTAQLQGWQSFNDIMRRMQDPDMLNRDLTQRERNVVRGWFGMGPEVSETEQCA